MKNSKLFTLCTIALFAMTMQSCQERPAKTNTRQVAITIDDLPIVYPTTADSALLITQKLLATLTK